MIKYKEVSIGNMCNNDCLYCRYGNETRENRYLSEIEADLKQHNGYESVLILGGEPAIRNDFIDMLNCARLQNYKRIKLITNGRAFSDRELARATVEYGVRLFEIKLAGFAPEIHETITGVTGSFNETIQGIINLKSIQIPEDESKEPFIAIRIPICEENYEYQEDIVRFIVSLGVDRIIISFDDYNLTMHNALSHLYNAVETAIFSRIWIQTEKIPLCLMSGYEHHVSEAFIDHSGQGFKQVSACAKCAYGNSCKGIVCDYLEKNRSGGFRPVTKSKHSLDLENLCSATPQGA